MHRKNKFIILKSDQTWIRQNFTNIHKILLAAEKAFVPKKLVKLHGPKWKASPKVRQILMERKQVYREWITMGRPGPEHPLSPSRERVSSIRLM